MITLTDLQFRWRRNQSPVLEIACYEQDRSEAVLLRGPSGSGKTTLLNLLGGITIPENGEVVISGTDIARLKPNRRDSFRADHIGFVFQLFNLLPYLGLLDNVTLPCQFSVRRRRRACEIDGSIEASAERLLSHMGLDLVGLRDRSVVELSVGQQQRVAAARALIGGPELLIADEPTSAFDPETRDLFLDLIFDEAKKREITILMVSHETGFDDRFDRVVDLADINTASREGQAHDHH